MTYRVEISHSGLGRRRVVVGYDYGDVQSRVRAIRERWAEEYERRLQRQAQRNAREAGLVEAAERTQEAKEEIERAQSLLVETLRRPQGVDWNAHRRRDAFELACPPPPPDLTLPPPPAWWEPNYGFLDRVWTSRRLKKQNAAEEAHRQNQERWEEECQRLRREHAAAVAEQQERVRAWERQRDEFLGNQKQHNHLIDQWKKAYDRHEPEAVLKMAKAVLKGSPYPDYCPAEFQLHLDPGSSMLAVDYELPNPDETPSLDEVTYIQSKAEFREKHLTKRVREDLYDLIIYQITLRSIHELFGATPAALVEFVVFNGWVTNIDKATGREVHPCIATIQVSRGEMAGLDLAHVNPKECFRRLKGISSSQLAALAAVAPVLAFDKTDARFVPGEAVTVAEGDNLAAMDWQAFEHLIRELFEREFNGPGGEVKVTRASRDGGVDAVAFDPDPIRGGKIVIQAKRYVNPVGVSAVRDLYGTILNEGANSGILVTTSTFGPDAYQFAKDKPIKLLNGSHLLHLLEKHGRKARIDLQDARKRLGLD